jgi:hypothetical protein
LRLRSLVEVYGAFVSILVCAMLLQTATLCAQQTGPLKEEKGTVTYVTSTTVYGDLGRKHGLREGDTVFVNNAGGRVASLRVLHLSSKSFSAEVLEKSATILQGNALLARVRLMVEQPRPKPVVDSAVTFPVERVPTPATAPLVSGGSAAGHEAARIRGRLALQYYAMNSAATSGLAFSQPAAVLNFTAEHLLELPLQFSYYSNHRYDARSGDARAGVDQNRLRNRFYQFALQYGGEAEPYTAVLGRFIPYQVGGIGTVDGVMLAGRSGAFEGGVLAGSQPGYRDSELSLKDQKIAAFAGYTHEEDIWRLRSNLAFAQTYRDGAVDRGYFYLVNSVSLGNEITLFQNASLDLYDADRGSGRSRPHLTDLYLSATWRPERWLSLTGAFADRRSVYFLRSFASIPDSLFNQSRLRNYSLSAGVNIPGGMYASVSASLRAQENSGSPASAYSARYTFSNLLSSRVNVYLLGSYADNLYNTARSMGIEANRDLFEGFYTALRLQQYRFVYTANNRALDRITAALDVYYRIGTLWYLSVNYERYWEGGIGSDRIYSEISVRWR